MLPDVHNIKWAMNGATLDCESKKYLGGGLKDCHFIITSPTGADIGRYSCTVTNGVGTASKEVIIGNVMKLKFGNHSPHINCNQIRNFEYMNCSAVVI